MAAALGPLAAGAAAVLGAAGRVAAGGDAPRAAVRALAGNGSPRVALASPASAGAAAGLPAGDGGAQRVPLTYSDYRLLLAAVEVEGQEAAALLDTGGATGIQLSGALATALGVPLAPAAGRLPAQRPVRAGPAGRPRRLG